MKTGIELITEARQRQTSHHGYSADHDDEHTGEELVDAAAVYLDLGTEYEHNISDAIWPWNDGLKPATRIENLANAGALIAAEIDRLQRMAERDTND